MNSYRYLFQFCLPVVLLISACSGPAEEQPEIDTEADLSLEETLVIESGDGETPGKPLIAFAGYVTADREGNIYVHDGSDGQKSIHKYDSEGNHLFTFSGEGSGPGEHRALTAMYANSRGELITSDRQNARFTLFSAEGEELITRSFPGFTNVMQISEWPERGFAVTAWNEQQQKLVHLFDSELEEEGYGAVSMEELPAWYEDDDQKRWLARSTGYITPLSGEEMIYIPHHYDGSMFRFAREGDEWTLADTVSGYRSIEPPVTFHDPSDVENQDRVSQIIMTPGQTYMIINESKSFGLFPLRDGSYLHLSFAYSDEKTDLVVERFSPDMELLQHMVTDTLELGHTHRKQPFWVDRDGQIYLTDNSDIPAVRRFRVTGLGL